MKNNIFSDIKTAAGVFKDIRQGRRNGNEMVIEKRVQIPCICVGVDFYDTVEGCVLSNCGKEVHDIALNAFQNLSNNEKRRLSFSPENGDFITRANFWKALLKPLMTPIQYGTAITAILHWYIHIKHMRM